MKPIKRGIDVANRVAHAGWAIWCEWKMWRRLGLGFGDGPVERPLWGLVLVRLSECDAVPRALQEISYIA